MRLLAALIVLVGFVPLAGQDGSRTAAEIEALGPPVGTHVPDFSLPDQTGRPRTLQSLSGPNGTLLVFFRSAGW